MTVLDVNARTTSSIRILDWPKSFQYLLPLPKVAVAAPAPEVLRRSSARLAKDPMNKGTIMQKATDKVARELKFIGPNEDVSDETLAKLLKLFAAPLTEAVIEALSFLAGIKGKAEMQVTHV